MSAIHNFNEKCTKGIFFCRLKNRFNKLTSVSATKEMFVDSGAVINNNEISWK